MTTVVNNPGTDSGGGAGLVVGIIVGILVIVALIFYVVPGLRGRTAAPDNTKTIDVNVALPQGGGSTSGGTGAPAGGTGGY